MVCYDEMWVTLICVNMKWLYNHFSYKLLIFIFSQWYSYMKWDLKCILETWFVLYDWLDLMKVRASGGPLTHCHGVCCFETCVNARFIISFLVLLSLYNLSNLIHVLFHRLVVMQCTPRFRWVMVRNRILVWVPLIDGPESLLLRDPVEWWSGIVSTLVHWV